MNETPHEPRERASLRGKGWEILRGSEPSGAPLPEDMFVRPQADEAQPAEDEAVLDRMAAPERAKLTASPAPPAEGHMADRPVAAEELPTRASAPVTGEEFETQPRVEAVAADRPQAILSYVPRPEVESLAPDSPEAMGEEAEAPIEEAEASGDMAVGFSVVSQPATGELEKEKAIIRPQDVRIDAGRLTPVSGPRAPARELFAEARAVAPSEELLEKFVTDERLEKLWSDIEALQEQIVRKVQGRRDLTDAYQKELLEASALLLQGRANYDDVRAILYRVRADLAREEKVQADIAKYKPPIIRYLLLAFILWLALMAVEPLVRQFMIDSGLDALSIIYHPTLFGMLGAIVYAYFTLNKHAIQLRDFDPAHLSWYLMNPVIGLIMGLLMTLVFTTGIVSTIGVGLLDQASESSMLGQYPFLLWVLCFLAGYNQNVVLRLLYRTFGFLRGRDSEEGRDQSPPSPTSSVR